MPFAVWDCITWVWMLVGAYWLASALRAKPVPINPIPISFGMFFSWTSDCSRFF